MTAPLLETARLRLRAHQATDHASMSAISADPLVVRFLGGQPFPAEQSWARLLRFPGLWDLLGYGYWAIEQKADGRYIGHIGYADFKRDIVPMLDGMPELGWVLASDVHGQGYATEALAAVLAWGDAHFGEHHASCIISPENVPSLRLAGRAGFRLLAQTMYQGHAVNILIR